MPEIGRFVTEDPAKDGGNWYIYCANDPVNFKDSTGEKAVKSLGEFRDGLNAYTFQDNLKANSLSEKAENNAVNFSKLQGYYQINSKGKRELITWDNLADAMRHTQWNSMMTREMSYEKARFYANNHEIAELRRLGWISEIDGNIVTTKMNQPTLMDLWNNSTGRALGMDPALADMGYGDLMVHAMTYNMLITDASKTYEFYGVTEYINKADWTVNVKWDTLAGTITFMKDGLSDITLRIGRWGI